MMKVKLRELRATRGDDGRIVTIARLSRETGLSRDYLTRFERGELNSINLGSARKICNFFKCDMGDLISFNSEG